MFTELGYIFYHSIIYLLKRSEKKLDHESSMWQQDSKASFLYKLSLTTARKA